MLVHRNNIHSTAQHSIYFLASHLVHDTALLTNIHRLVFYSSDPMKSLDDAVAAAAVIAVLYCRMDVMDVDRVY